MSSMVHSNALTASAQIPPREVRFAFNFDDAAEDGKKEQQLEVLNIDLSQFSRLKQNASVRPFSAESQKGSPCSDLILPSLG